MWLTTSRLYHDGRVSNFLSKLTLTPPSQRMRLCERLSVLGRKLRSGLLRRWPTRMVTIPCAQVAGLGLWLVLARGCGGWCYVQLSMTHGQLTTIVAWHDASVWQCDTSLTPTHHCILCAVDKATKAAPKKARKAEQAAQPAPGGLMMWYDMIRYHMLWNSRTWGVRHICLHHVS